jgi:hypothetical protein
MPATTGRVSASRHLRVTTGAGVRVAAAEVTAGMWGSSAGMRSSSTRVAVRRAGTRATTWVSLMAVIARYRRMSAARGAVILTAGTTVTSGAGTTVILGAAMILRSAVILSSMSARATVMRYVVTNRATMRATSMRGNNTSSRELSRSSRRSYRGPSVVERCT